MAVTPYDPLYPKTPRCTRTSHGSMFYRTMVIADGSFALREYGFSTLFVPVTLTLIRWISCTNLTCISWRSTGCANMNLLRQGFRKLSSDIDR